MSAGRRIVMAFAIIAFCAGLVGIVSHYRASGSLYMLALATFAPYLGLCVVVAGVLFAIVRTPIGWVGFALSSAIVIWLIAVQVPIYIAETAPSSGADIVVMTSNLKIGQADPRAVVAAVRAHHVDVLMLEELTPGIRLALQHAGLDELLPNSVSDPHDGGAGTGLWSRFTLTNTAMRDDLGFAFVNARIAVAGNSVGLAALHIVGPSPQSQFPRWRADMEAYPRVLRRLPGHVVLIGGDFNSTTDVIQFRNILDQGFGDGATQAGAGYTPTWPADRWYPPLITIDHVLTRGAVATSAASVEIPASDHRALVVTIRIPAAT